jgi:tetratricopeptide (TPR) repeat protein
MMAAMRHGLLALVPLALQFASLLPGQTVEWWQKDFDGALAAGKDKPSSMVMLYCWRDPNDNCSAMFGGTLSDKEVAPVLADFVCMGLKENDATQKAILAKYGIEKLPTVLFVQPDGAVVDAIPGYVPVKEFLAEVARIKAGTKTVAALRKLVAEKPADLALQLELVHKLRAVGDKKGSLEVIDAIGAKDPKAVSEAAAEAMLLKLNDQIFKPELLPKDYDLKPLREFLNKQKNKRILFLGYDHLAAAEWKRDNLKIACEYAERAWKNIPPDQVLDWGQNIASKAYEAYKELEKIDKTLLKKALDVSEKALKEVEKQQKTAPDNPFYANALYLHAAMLNVNNLRKEAFAMMDKAMQVDPKNENLKRAKEQWVDGSK